MQIIQNYARIFVNLTMMTQRNNIIHLQTPFAISFDILEFKEEASNEPTGDMVNI